MMKIAGWTLCWISLVSAPTFAQQATRAADGGIVERFRQLDRNGDGKVSAEEHRGLLFEQMDGDGDGFVTADELSKPWKTG